MLPATWRECHLDELCSRIVDGSHNPPTSVPAGQPMLSARNIGFGEIFFDEFRLISSDKFEIEDARTRIRSGTVLLTIVGALGRSVFVKKEHCIFTVQRSVGVLHANGSINPSYLKRVFDCSWAQKWFQDQARGTAQRGVYLATLGEFPVPLPPLAEQRRIVAKLEALTARIARARAELERSFKLTQDFRSETLTDAFNLSRAAEEGVATAIIGDIADISLGYAFPKHLQGKPTGRYPFAKVSDISQSVIKDGGNLTTAANYVDDVEMLELKAKAVGRGATVFAKIGEALRLNRRAITQSSIVIDNNCMVLSPRPTVDARWLFRFMQTVDLSPFAVATAIPSVRRGDVAALELPLPDLAEQDRRLARLDAAFAHADRLDAEAMRAKKLLDRLESAILAKAFRGELVPQDPADEPASVLLDRIRAERAAVPKPKRGRRASAGA